MTTPRYPILDRRINYDQRSKSYGIAPIVAGTPRVRTLWTMPKNFPLNQGVEGACVGFGWAGELGCEPVIVPQQNADALRIYSLARDEDARMGHSFPDGASVLAGAKACQKAGWISNYRWAFGVSQVVDALCAKGPVVLGIPWYESMYQTEASGLVRVNGQVAGGHCILATGYWPSHDTLGGNVIQLTNSWGPTWGKKGVGWIREMDLESLLQQEGEACIATDRQPGKGPWWRRFLEMW